MVAGFFAKKIEYQNTNVGSILRSKREDFGFSFSNTSDQLKISKNYLVAMEENNYNFLPENVYLKKIVSSYAKFLNINNGEDLAEVFLAQKELYKKINSDKKERFLLKKVSSWKLFLFPYFVRILLLLMVVLGVGIYFGRAVENIFSPPSLIIYSPEKKSVTDNEIILISGKTDQEVEVKINEQIIVSSRDGFFEQSLNLRPGLNLIKVVAKKKHSQEKVELIDVVVLEKEVNNNDLSLK